jgi:hypothetical protein
LGLASTFLLSNLAESSGLEAVLVLVVVALLTSVVLEVALSEGWFLALLFALGLALLSLLV